MARRYTGFSNATNTVSTTVPMFTIVGAATTRLRLYDFISGSDATPADAATKLGFRRISAAGTTSATVTPTALDPADPASLAAYGTRGTSTRPSPPRRKSCRWRTTSARPSAGWRFPTAN
jgi:hypothetical protein